MVLEDIESVMFIQVFEMARALLYLYSKYQRGALCCFSLSRFRLSTTAPAYSARLIGKRRTGLSPRLSKRCPRCRWYLKKLLVMSTPGYQNYTEVRGLDYRRHRSTTVSFGRWRSCLLRATSVL